MTIDAGDVALIASLIGILASAGTFITFWIKLAAAITKSQSTAESALAEAAEAFKETKESHEKIALLKSEFGLYREQVAREYIHREALREMEDRLTASIDRLGDRLDRFLEGSNRS